MTREERLKFCKTCINRKSDFHKGLLCSLTNDFAAFENECSDYVVDEVEKERQFKKQLELAGDAETGSDFDYKKNKELGSWLLIIGIGVLLITLFSDSMSIVIIPGGLIITGFVMHSRGVAQEKIIKEKEEEKD